MLSVERRVQSAVEGLMVRSRWAKVRGGRNKGVWRIWIGAGEFSGGSVSPSSTNA